jgi:NAD(P)-dependent dehydrogenase (short-subunit alcohol dehydrogenase family)
MDPKWFAPHVAYTMAKYGMSQCVLGMAGEFAADGIAINALWPRTVIHTAALAMIPGVDPERCRTPEIMADAAHAVLTAGAGNDRPLHHRRGSCCASAAPPISPDMRWTRHKRCCRTCSWTTPN